MPETRFSSSSTAGIGDTRRGGFMQRFLTFVVLLLLTVPVGLSLQGCANKNSNYCNGVGFGYTNGQPVSISLQPQTTGLSVAFSQTSQLQAPSAQDCKGSSASVGTYTYGTVRPDHRRRFAHGGDLRRHMESSHPRSRRVHHLPPHQQDGRRLYDRQRRRIYQQPGRGVFPSSAHQHLHPGSDEREHRRASMPFPGANQTTGRHGLLHVDRDHGFMPQPTMPPASRFFCASRRRQTAVLPRFPSATR